MKRRINDRQKKFAECVVAGMTQVQSYLEAYQGSPKTAKSRASDLRKHPVVDEYIKYLLNGVRKDPIMSAQELLEEYTTIARDKTNHISHRMNAMDKLGKYHGVTNDGAAATLGNVEVHVVGLDQKRLTQGSDVIEGECSVVD